MIAAGMVLVGGAPATKASRMVGAGEPITVLGPPPRFVSRGGEKLEAALGRFAVQVAGHRVLDAGASTGGFTDCLLQRGAARVVSVDVGHGQLHERIRADTRVEVRERLNIRHAGPADFGGDRFALIVADLSFISLATVAPALAGRLARPGGDLVLLVKPQFEAGRQEVSRGRGVIRDPAAWMAALNRVRSALQGQRAAMIDAMVSPLKGADGNVEFLTHALAHAPGREIDDDALRAVVESAGAGG